MSTEPSIVDVQARPGAGIEVRTSWRDLVPTIRKTFDRLYAPGAVDRSVHGHNFIIYSKGDREGGTLVVGIENATPGTTDADVRAVTTPAGRAATAPHFGDYGAMRPTYDAIEAFIKAQGMRRTDVSMELYGDMGPDPATVRTDLFIWVAA